MTTRFQLGGTLAILAVVLLSILGIGCGPDLVGPSQLPPNCKEVYHPAKEDTQYVRDQFGRLIPVIIRTPARTEIVCE